MSEVNDISAAAVAEPPAVEPRSVKIRNARIDDYAQIAAVQVRNGLGAKNEQQWRHLWVDNPICIKRPDIAIGWVAETSAGEIVGYMGNIPSGFTFRGNEMVSGATFAMVIDPAHSAYAGFLGKRFICQKNIDIQLVTSANPNSARLVAPLYGRRVPAGDWEHSVYWITNYQGFTAGAFAMKKWPHLAAYPAALAMVARDKISRSGFRKSPMHVPLTLCSEFDLRFDAFWEELKLAYPHRLLGYRTSEVLQWHFKFALEQGRVWILTTGKGSRITAYAIFYRHDNPRIGLKRVRLIDFQTTDGNVDVLGPMLEWAYDRCRKEDIHMLEAYGFRPDKEAVIESMGPHRRQLPSWFYYYNSRNKDIVAMLQDPEVWDPCHFDGDSSL